MDNPCDEHNIVNESSHPGHKPNGTVGLKTEKEGVWSSTKHPIK